MPARSAERAPPPPLPPSDAPTHAPVQPALPDGERTLLAALAPTPQSAHVLALACRTWHDHVWAALGALCEARLARLLAAADGEQFWEGGELPDDARPGAAAVLSADDEEAEEGEWAEETRRMLAALGNVRVEDGCVRSARVGMRGALLTRAC